MNFMKFSVFALLFACCSAVGSESEKNSTESLLARFSLKREAGQVGIFDSETGYLQMELITCAEVFGVPSEARSFLDNHIYVKELRRLRGAPIAEGKENAAKQAVVDLILAKLYPELGVVVSTEETMHKLFGHNNFWPWDDQGNLRKRE